MGRPRLATWDMSTFAAIALNVFEVFAIRVADPFQDRVLVPRHQGQAAVAIRHDEKAAAAATAHFERTRVLARRASEDIAGYGP